MPRPLLRPDRVTWTVVGLTALALLIDYLIKDSCTGGPFDALGRSANFASTPGRFCYNDLQYLWHGRALNTHVFPYLSGWIDDDGRLHDGAVEYPVLSGVLLWLGALGARTDQQYLAHMALLMAPFGLAIGYLLAQLCGRAALLWPLAPPLAFYAFHNLELPVVFTAVAAVAVIVAAERRGSSLRVAGIWAAALLGIGFALKLYPAIFTAPLALYVLTGGRAGVAVDERTGRVRRDWVGAVGTVLSATVVEIAANAPFALLGWDGWRGSLKFQELRTADLSTNSVWFWGVRQLFSDTADYNDFVSWASPLAVILGFLVALAVGWFGYRRTGVYPWVGVSAAMLCAFMLLHKVHSPQYMLWLLPFFVLLRVRWPLVLAYLVCDVALDISIWPYLQQTVDGADVDLRVRIGMWTGVWGRAALLAWFVVTMPLRPERLRAIVSTSRDRRNVLAERKPSHEAAASE
jgi:hypothetical protein